MAGNKTKHKVTEKSLQNLRKGTKFSVDNPEYARECNIKARETREANKERREALGCFSEYADEIGAELVDFKGGKITKKKVLVHVLFQLASKGNLKAIELLAKLYGEIDNQKNVMVNGNLGIQKVFITPEQDKMLDDKIDELLSDE